MATAIRVTLVYKSNKGVKDILEDLPIIAREIEERAELVLESVDIYTIERED